MIAISLLKKPTHFVANPRRKSARGHSRFVWAGSAAVAALLSCTAFVTRDMTPTEPSQYLSQILTARVGPQANPNATISMFESKEDRMIVLWTEGLTSLSADYAAK